ncbi:gap junction delta-4 protein-like [Synchiropus picturatus]
MGAADLLFITLNHSVSFTGKAWWMLMLVVRLLVLLLAGSTLFSDEQERFICNTIQPGCSNVCFDVFAPVSVFRLWLFHLILLCLPHVMFASYVAHKILSYRHCGAVYFHDQLRGGSPLALETGSSRELSLSKAAPEWGVPRFFCAYLLVVVVRILLELVFGAGQFFLFGLSLPKSFLCYEAPCTSGVECYISRRTEKTLMLYFMLGVTATSVLLSLLDLASSLKSMLRWRKKTRRLMEEMSKGEQSSVFTTATTEDTDVLLTKRTLPTKTLPSEEAKAPPHRQLNGGPGFRRSLSTPDRRLPECRPDFSRPPTPMSTFGSPQYVHHSPPKPPVSPRSETPGTPASVRSTSQFTTTRGQPSADSPPDRRAWV